MKVAVALFVCGLSSRCESITEKKKFLMISKMVGKFNMSILVSGTLNALNP